MQIFKAFFKVLKTKLPTVLMYISIFLIIAVIMADTSPAEKSFEASRLKVCIFDEDGTEASRALTEYIGKNHDLVKIEANEDEILDALYYGRASYVLTIKEGYGEKLSQGDTEELFTNYHVHDSYDAVLLSDQLDEYVKAVNAYTAGGAELSAAIKNADEALSHETSVIIESFENKDRSGSSVFSDTAGSYFQFLPYILLSVMVSALCPVLMTMNRKEIRYRTNSSCVKSSSHTLQILAGSAVFIIAIWIIFMIAGAAFGRQIYSGRGWIAVLSSFIFTLISADIAILVSSFDISDNAVNIINQVLGLGMSFLCGVFVPLSLLGDGVVSAARFLPAYWYVRINNMLTGEEAFDSSKLMVYLGIEAAFAVSLAIFTLLVRRLRYNAPARLEK